MVLVAANLKMSQGQTVEPIHGVRRMAAIDILRAFAALWVVAFHVYLYTPGIRNQAKGLLISFAQAGHVGVNLFLVLSGFCVFSGLYKNQPERNIKVDVRKFFKRRFLRIYPAYFAALVVATASVALLADPDILKPAIFLQKFGTHALFIHNLFPSTILSVDGPFWSLALEVQLYVLMPLFILFVNRIGWKGLLGGTLALTAATQVLSGHFLDRDSVGIWTVWHSGVLARCFEFACGMFACHLYYRREPVKIPILAMVSAIILVAFARCIRDGNASGVFVDQMFGIGFAAMILMALRLPEKVVNAAPMRLLEGVGLISYSLYLLHNNALNRFWLPYFGHGLSPMTQLYVNLTIFPTLLCLVSWGFWRLFEYPALRQSRAKAVQPVMVDGAPEGIRQVA